MIFIIGPLYAGKKNYIQKKLGLTEEELLSCAVIDAHEQAYDLPAPIEAHMDALEELADRLAAAEIVISTETGGGVVPVDPIERQQREAAGRLNCALAERADTVIRVCCGLPQILKGSEKDISLVKQRSQV